MKSVKFSFLLVLLLGIGSMLLFNRVSASPYVVDHFDSVQNTIAMAPGTLPITSCTSVTDGNVVGGQRDVQVQITGYQSGGGDIEALINNNGNSLFSLDQDSGVEGWVEVVWDGEDPCTSLNPVGLGGEDFTFGGVHDSLRMGVSSDDLPADVTFTVYTDANNWRSYVLELPGFVFTPRIFNITFAEIDNSGSGQGTVDWTNIGALVMRIQSDSPSLDLRVHFVETTSSGYVLDFGDLPEEYGVTTIDDDGARHEVGNLFLGYIADTEGAGLESTGAVGDDEDGYPDEEGVTRVGTSRWVPGNTAQLTVRVTGGAGYLVGWFDWDGNGAMAAGEMVEFGSVNSGLNTVSLVVPPEFTRPLPDPLDLYARFRLYSSDPGTPTPTGLAVNGEVEDYFWQFNNPTAVSLSAFSGTSQQGLATAVAVLFALLSAVTAVFFIRRRRTQQV